MDEESVEFVRRFLGILKEHYDVQKAYVFGSRARDDYLKGSDIDVLLVSPSFRGVRFPDRTAKVLEYWDFEWGEPQVLCYTPEEFEDMRKRLTIVGTAVREGVPVEP